MSHLGSLQPSLDLLMSIDTLHTYPTRVPALHNLFPSLALWPSHLCLRREAQGSVKAWAEQLRNASSVQALDPASIHVMLFLGEKEIAVPLETLPDVQVRGRQHQASREEVLGLH